MVESPGQYASGFSVFVGGAYGHKKRADTRPAPYIYVSGYIYYPISSTLRRMKRLRGSPFSRPLAKRARSMS